jgi:Tol biopolymer transport system component
MVFAALISTTILTACGQQGATSQSSTQGPPFNLSYATNPANYTYGVAITPNILTASKSVNTLSISPELPTGLTFDPTTGTISGTPTTITPSAGYTVSGTNSYGSNFVVLQLAIVDFPPTLTYLGPNPVSAYTVGTAITPITPTLGGGATLSCNSSPQLPAGLTLSSACVISGTPTTPTAANNYTISAINSGGSASFTVNLTVDAIAPAIAYPSSPYTFVHGEAAPATSVVNSGGPIVSCSISPTLPTGLTFSTTTCQIAGTPSVIAASQTYTVIAANTGGSSTATVIITVSDIVPVIHYSPATYALTRGTAISPIAVINTGGVINTCSASALPTGLSIDAACNITGTPTTLSTATIYNITASNTAGSSISTPITFTVNDVLPNIHYTGSPYTFFNVTPITSFTPTNTGGPIISCAVSPALPAGMTFSTVTCAIAGTPSAASAAANYTVTATNSGGSSNQVINIQVKESAPVITYSSSTFTFNRGSPITPLNVTNTGGPIVSCATFPALPVGLSLNTTTCQISGNPTATTAPSTYTITATNSAGSGSKVLTITVNDSVPALTYTGSPYVLTNNQPISTITPVNGGGTVISCSILPTLPTGLSLSTTCGISGTPSALSAATSYTVTATNSGGNSTASFNLAVIDSAPIISYAGSPYNFAQNTAITTISPANSGGSIVSCSISTALPSGLSFSTTGCQISGTPTATSPTTNYTITATNTGGTNSTSISITVTQLPNISYVGSPFAYTLGTPITPLSATNTGGTIASCFTFPNLPTGLSISSTTCQISGTPSAITASASYLVTATNAGGQQSTSITIAVNDVVPALTYSGTPFTLTQNQTVSTITPTNTGGTPTSCSVLPALPTGLTFNTTTCSISGTPTVLHAASAFTVTATNTGGSSTATVSIAVVATAPVIAYAGSPYTFNESAAIAAQTPSNTGSTIVSCAISPTLPTGLAFNTTTCVISGTPTVASVATSYTVTATNTGGSNSTSISITVLAPPVITYTGSPFTYTVNSMIPAVTATNTGGTIASCSASPALPAGLSLSTTTCQITGTPTAISTATTYTITATNAAGSSAPTISITVKDVVPALTYSGNPYSFTLNQPITTVTPTNTGGTPTGCTVLPALPTGLTLTATTCAISGTPTVLHASSAFTVTATNTGGTSTASVTLAVIAAAPVISYAGSPYTFNKSAAITAQTPSNTGGAIVSCAITPALPTGLAFSTTTCVISGTPTVASAATNYTITATNTGGSGATSVSITVLTAPVIAYTGSPFTYAVNSAIPVINATNTGGTIASCSASPALPAGLNISNTTCQVSGTPTAVTANAAYTITATNSAGSGTASITMNVNDIVPALTYVDSPYKFSLNQTITNVIPNNTGGNPTSCSIAPGLPTGLALNTTTCVISGTPTVLHTASAFTVTATNSGGSSTASVNVAVVALPPAIAYAGSPYIFVKNTPITTQTPSNTGGAIVSCTISPTLPTGLAFSATTCAISGDPTVLSSATNYTVTPTNTGGSSPISITLEVDLTAPMFVMARGVASVSPQSQVVYYSRSITGINNIWKISIDGTNPTNISQDTSSSALPEYPSFSPDGSEIVFASQASSQSYNIWTVGAEGMLSSDMSALTENSAVGLDSNSPPSYSAVGTKIIFASKMNLSGQPNEASNPSYNIWIMNADGSGKVALTQNSIGNLDSINPVFSPDGSTVYFQSETDLSGQWNGTAAKYNIWKVGTNGSAPTALTTQSASDGFDSGEPRVSPDGTKIVFTSFMKIGTVAPASTNIWTVSNSGSDLTNLTASFASGQDSKNPSFSPDGSEITFASKWDGEASFNIWLMKYDGSNAVNLTGAVGAGQDSTSPSFSPDSLHIAFTSRLNIMGTSSASNNIWVMNSNGSGQIPLTQNTSSGLDSFIGTIGVWFAP